MLTITHGYDFAIPSESRGGFLVSLQRIMNAAVGNGRWLLYPLRMKAITSTEEQKAVLYTMITEMNEMLISLANYNGFPNLFHIDNRGIARESDWFDELHLKSGAFGKVTDLYRACIKENRYTAGTAFNSGPLKKVYRPDNIKA